MALTSEHSKILMLEEKAQKGHHKVERLWWEMKEAVKVSKEG